MRQVSIPAGVSAPAGLVERRPSWRRRIGRGNPICQHRIRLGRELTVTSGRNETRAVHCGERRHAYAYQKAESTAGRGLVTALAIAAHGILGLRHLMRHARGGRAHQSGRQADPQAEEQRNNAIQFPDHDTASILRPVHRSSKNLVIERVERVTARSPQLVLHVITRLPVSCRRSGKNRTSRRHHESTGMTELSKQSRQHVSNKNTQRSNRAGGIFESTLRIGA